jgi:hypothetical protein
VARITITDRMRRAPAPNVGEDMRKLAALPAGPAVTRSKRWPNGSTLARLMLALNPGADLGKADRGDR